MSIHRPTWRSTAALVTFALLATGGCARDADDGDEAALGAPETSDQEIRDGVLTFERPEIGMMVTNGMSFCTATLVSPNAVLTAAHCVGYGTHDGQGEKQGWFRIERSATEHVDFDYDAYVSYGGSWGRDDVALLRLMNDVPREIAKPAAIALAAPTDESNEKVTIFGYGCSVRPGLFGGGGGGNTQKKQMRQFEMGPVRYVCPGDSGGPTVRGLYGEVFRVSSRMFTFEIFGWGNPDAFGDVVRHRGAILDRIASWRPADER